jgi:diguanylate cyclase (GGDEF)-like protein
MHKIALLYDASQAVLSTFDLAEVMERILSVISNYFHLPHSAIFLRDPGTNELHPRARSGWPEDLARPAAAVGLGLVGVAAEMKRPMYAPNVHQDPRYVQTIATTSSQLAVPLLVGDEVVGVLDCQSPVENFFDQETIDLLTLFSTQASVALQNAQLHQLERRRAAQLEIINQIARQTTAVTDMDELLQNFCDLLLKSFPVDHVSVLLLDENRLVLRAHSGKLTALVAGGAYMPADAGLGGRALANGSPALANDVNMEPDYVPILSESRAELSLPLLPFGQKLGVLVLSSALPNAFRDFDLQPLQSVADICAAALQNAIYFDRVRQLAYRDGLTGVFNRRYFEMRVLQELERARRYGLVLSIIMLDVDGFKPLNDEFGHLLGDETLRQISTLLTQQMRKADIVCRYGGDEFAVLLPETAGDNALTAAEKLRRGVDNWEFPGVPRPITVSIGIASYPTDGASRDELVKAADDALYRAKQEGKNCIRVALGQAKARQLPRT